MKKILFASICCIGLLLSSCTDKAEEISGEGEITKNDRIVTDFNQIEVQDDITLELSYGPNQLAVETNQNIHEYVITFVENNCLIIKLKNFTILDKNTTIKVYASSTYFTQITGTNSTEIKFKDELKGDSIKIKAEKESSVEGSVACSYLQLDFNDTQNIHLNINSEETMLTASESKGITLQGKTDKLLLNMEESRLYGFNLEANFVNAKLEDGSYGEQTVKESLLITLNDASTFTYKGNPGNIKENISSDSSFNKAD